MKTSQRNPFPGLRAFTDDESRIYFGRESQVDELLRRLRKHRFLAVVGSSGSGKSSLVRAGLIPALQGGQMNEAGSLWKIALFRPIDDPIGNLARALNDDRVFGSGEESERSLEISLTEMVLRTAASGLSDVAAENGMANNVNLLIVVDQFEELFRFRNRQKAQHNAKDEADSFVRLLLNAVTEQKRFSIFVMITMRSDYLGDCAAFGDLPQAMNESQYLIPRLNRSELESAIRGPIAVGGASIADRLVNLLINDIGADQDQLPVLQHALMRTWDHWERTREGESDVIDIRNYEAIGKMSHALADHADSVYDNLPTPQAQRIASVLFKCITDRSADPRGIRRPTTIKEVAEVAGVDEAEVSEVVNEFRAIGRTFILPMPPPKDLTPETSLDLSHESLLRIWSKLEKWADEEVNSSLIYNRLADTAVKGFALYREPELSNALDWLKDQKPTSTWAKRYDKDSDQQEATRLEQALAFLEQSKQSKLDEEKAIESARQEKEKQSQRELERANEEKKAAEKLGRRQRNQRNFMAISFVGAAVSAGLFWWQLMNATKAQARAFTITAQAQVIKDPLNSVVNGLAALKLQEGWLRRSSDASLDLVDTLTRALANNPQVDVINIGEGPLWTLVGLKKDVLISGGADGMIRRWRVGSDGKLLDPIHAESGQGAVLSLVELRNGELITGGADGNIRRWSSDLKPLGNPVPTDQNTVVSLVELENGEMITGGVNGTIRRWKSDLTPLGNPVQTDQISVMSVVALTNGEFYTGGMDGTIRRWRDGNALGGRMDTQQGPIRNVLMLKNGNLITASVYGSIRIWRARDGKPLSKSIDTGQSGVRSMIELKNGDLVTAGFDGTIRIWNLANGTEPKPKSDPIKSNQGLVVSLVEHKDFGFYTGGTDGTIRRWKLSNFDFRVDNYHGLGKVISLVELKNGELITGGENGRIRCWRNGKLQGGLKGGVDTKQGKVLSMVKLNNGELITGGANGTILRWSSDCNNIKQVGKPINADKGPIYSMVLLNKDVLVTGGGGTIRRWRVGKTIDKIDHPINTGQPEVLSMLKLNNGQLITGGQNGTIRLWSSKGKPLGVPVSVTTAPSDDDRKKNAVTNLLELKNGELITGGGDSDGTIRRWRIGKTIGQIGKPILTYQGPILSMLELENNVLITGGEKGTIRSWRDGKALSEPIELAQGPVSSMVMLKSGELITGGVVKFRRWPPKELILRNACEMLNKSQSDPRAKEEAWVTATNFCKQRTILAWKS